MSQVLSPSETGDADLFTRVGIALTLRLKHTPHAVHVGVDRGTVTLRGAIPTFYDRQLAIEVTRRMAGVMRVVDKLTVPQTRGGPKTNSSNSPRQASTAALHGAETEVAKCASDLPARIPVGRSLRFGLLLAETTMVLRGMFLAIALVLPLV